MSVVICAWTSDRWDALLEAIASVRAQDPLPHEVIVVVDHNDDLLARLKNAVPEVRSLPNADRRGLSGGRNTGVRHTTGDVVAFLDDDAIAAPGWLGAIVDACRQPRVVGVGGPVLPRWEGVAPAWMPVEFLWVVGCSFRGQPTEAIPIRNPIGANMAFRRDVFEQVGGFTHALARTSGTRLVSCDETEFSIRVRQRLPEAEIVLAPGMRVEHIVPADRTTWRYFRTRCFGEGFAKALVSGTVGPRDGLSSERSHLVGTLPGALLGGLADGVRGDRDGPRRAAAIVMGVVTTAAGYARGSVARRRPRQAPFEAVTGER